MRRNTIILISLALILGIKFWPKKASQNDKEKVLHLAMETRIQGLDPVVSTNMYETRVIAKVYEGLLEYHYWKRPFELTTNLAVAMPIISEDGLTYTFTLKPAVYFQDNACFPNGKGREITAKDFVYSFKRIADPAVQSPYFSELEPIIKGMDAFRTQLQQHKGDYSIPMEGVQALDNYTLRFTLTKPSTLFLHFLAQPFAYVVPSEAVAYYGADFINHPVGTGPFTLGQFSPQDNKIILAKNKHFRDKFFPTVTAEEPDLADLAEASGKKLPFVDTIIYHTLPEPQPRWLQFKEKKIDCLNLVTAYLPDVFKHKQFNPALHQAGIKLLAENGGLVGYIGFNCCQKPLDNIKLRQAISLAFDRAAFKKTFREDLGEIVHSFIPNSFVGYSETFTNPYAICDIEKAKQYLAEAGYPGGQGLPILTVICSDNQKIQLDFFDQCMRKIGIKVEVQPCIFSELVNKLNKGNYMLAVLSEQFDYPDAAAVFNLLRNPHRSGMTIIDQKFNQLYDIYTQKMLDPAEKASGYAQLNALATELTPALLLPSFPNYVLINKRVKYYRPSPYNFGMEQYIDVA
ncbi:MAG: ABC transporter substrate-binding protein [Candidatus Cardinium sp.]|nr:ABC transporter substrate-binding protein [Candidatus Cardinium sp.]